MYKIKHPKKRNSSLFMAVVPSGKTLVSILTSPKAVLDKLKKNGQDINNNYKINNN